MKNTVKSGYIIPLSLILLTVAVVIVTAIYVRGIIFYSLADTIIKREKAKLLALSGGQIAISQLSERPKKEEKGEEKKEDKKPAVPELLKQLIPIINRWQLFSLKETIDGIDGEIQIKISCEEGKIPINQIFDFQKGQYKGEKQPKGDWKQFMDAIFASTAKIIGAAELQNQLTAAVKKVKKPFFDVTQLLVVPGFSKFSGDIFSRPVAVQAKKIFLTDLFSTESDVATINPWLMSDSLITVLNLKSPSPDIRTKNAEVWIRTFKTPLSFPQDWNTIFKPIYEKDSQSLPKGIENFFATTFDPKHFCVVSYGKVGDVVQSVYLILERVKRVVKGKTSSQIIIKKAYYI